MMDAEVLRKLGALLFFFGGMVFAYLGIRKYGWKRKIQQRWS